MAAGGQTIISELSLDLSAIREQEKHEESRIEERLREFSSEFSSEQDDMEEVVIKETTPMRSDSTKLDLSGLTTSGSEDSGGPSLSRDRHRSSTLPSVSQRPFLASEAWGNTESHTDSGGNSRGMNNKKCKEGSDRSRMSYDGGGSCGGGGSGSGTSTIAVGRHGETKNAFSTDKLPLMPKRNLTINVSPQRVGLGAIDTGANVSLQRASTIEKSVGFGTTYIRDSGTLQSMRVCERPLGQPRALPAFLRAHGRDRRVQAVTISKDPKNAVQKSEETVEIQKPKDFATLHLLARRSQGHMRYRYMSMINEWIAEHGMPNS